MADTNQEQPRPQYLAKLSNNTKMKINYVTNTVEPDLTWSMRYPRYICSGTIVLLLVLLAVVAVMGIIVYRISVEAALALMHSDQASIITTVSAALINLVIIYLLSYVSERK